MTKTGDAKRIEKSTPLEEVLKIGVECNQCGNCCRFGSGFVLEPEVTKIAAFLKVPKDKFISDMLEETEILHTKLFKFKSIKKQDKPYGPCTFLTDNKCSIQSVKPVHCRIGNCKTHGDDLHVWFIINHCLNIYDPESVRQYDSYIKTGGRLIPGSELEKIFPDKAVLKSILSYERFK